MTVETVMQPPTMRITVEKIDEALAQMKRSSHDYGYHITEDGFQGILTEEALSDAADDTRHEEIHAELYEDVPTISPESPIEEVLTDSIASDYSLPVVDEEGNLKGSLKREKVADIFSEK